MAGKSKAAEQPIIFSYKDYHEYLRDFYNFKKVSKSSYSYRQFSKDCKISSPSYLKEIIDRKHKITEKSLYKVISGLRLNKIESKYFEILVHFTNSDESQKEKWLKLLEENMPISDLYVVGKDDDFSYLSHWIYGFIFCFLSKKGTVVDIKYLQDNILFPIQIHELKDALELLLRKKLIEKTGDDTYRRARDFITTENDSRKLAIKLFHKTSLKLADMAIDLIPSEKMEFRSSTIRVPAEVLPKLKEHIRDFYNKLPHTLKDLAKECKKNEKNMIQINIQMFPMTKDIKYKK